MNEYGLVDIYVLYGLTIPNYFNRRIFYYSSLSDYLSSGNVYELKAGINFNPADGVNTELDIDSDQGDKFTYLLVVDSETGSIISRWYILEADRNLGGQYHIMLKRDVVAEAISNGDFTNTAPIFVEKGMLKDSDPLIVNDEGIKFNQIKKWEKILYQRSEQLSNGYIVGYFKSGTGASGHAEIASGITPTTVTAAAIAAATGIDVADINTLLSGGSVGFAKNVNLIAGILDASQQALAIIGMVGFQKITLNIDDNINVSSSAVEPTFGSWAYYIGNMYQKGYNSYVNGYASSYFNSIAESTKRAAFEDVINNDIPTDKFYSQSQLDKLRAYVGAHIVLGGQYWTIDQINTGTVTPHAEVVIDHGENSFFDGLTAALVDSGSVTSNGKIYLNYNVSSVTIELVRYTPQLVTSVSATISSSANTLKDAPYSMFMIPYGDAVYSITDNNSYTIDDARKLNKEIALKLAIDLAKNLSTNLYDLQILPYAPLDEFTSMNIKLIVDTTNNLVYWRYFDLAYIWDEDTQSYVDSGRVGIDINWIINDSDSRPVGAIIYPQISNFSDSTNSVILTAQDEVKTESQCNFYRLCSPNYNGVFEFNLAKNAMSVDRFIINCTYKPINPLIRVQPEFKGLYGQSFVDGRGLILGGDFSAPRINSEWANYQANNKYFADIFARDIQNLDFEQGQERFKEQIALGAGVIGAGGAGAMTGAKFGGGYGAIAGAAIGLASGGIGAILESAMSAEKRLETKDYMIDRFNFNLQTIKAIPETLAKNSSFSIINKIIPFVEYYSCTDEEKEALRRKIEYDGMTVGRIDNIVNYMSLDNSASKYFKGELIRANGIYEDSHYINALYDEIAKGVYI